MSLFASWPSWPKKISVEAWKKAHGVLGKSIETKHKIAAAITKIEALDAKMTRAYYNGGYVEHENLAGVERGIADWVDDKKNCDGFSQGVTAFLKTLKAAATEAGASKTIPKDVRLYLETISKEISDYESKVADHVRKVNKELKELKAKYEKEAKG